MSIFQDISVFVGSEKRSKEFENAFSTYLSEAEWGWELIKEYVLNLPIGSRILELGAGPKILSAKIASLDYEITALEPFTPGFSIMKELGESIDSFSNLRSIRYASCDKTGENLDELDSYDLVFSINVMEHVSSVEETLDNVVSSLKDGGLCVFICPNYAFPFEPHFSSITLINKGLTDKYVKDRVLRKTKDPMQSVDLWNSLNWITTKQVFEWARKRDDISVNINRRSLIMYLNRTIGAEEFKSRHRFIANMSKLLLPIANVMPISLIPVMEVEIQKRKFD